MHRHDSGGSIKDHEGKVRQLESNLAATAGVLDQVQHSVGGAVSGFVRDLKKRFIPSRVKA